MGKTIERYAYRADLEETLPSYLKSDIAQLERIKSKDGLMGDAISQMEGCVDRCEFHKYISADQAFYIRLRYLGYRMDAAKAMRRFQYDRDRGKVEIWCAEDQICEIPSGYKVSPINSTYIFYAVTPPWFERFQPMNEEDSRKGCVWVPLKYFAKLPQDWRIWKSGNKSWKCIYFDVSGKGKLTSRYLMVKVRNPTPEDRYLL